MNMLQKSDTRVSLYAGAIAVGLLIVLAFFLTLLGIKIPIHLLMIISAYGIYRAIKGIKNKCPGAWWGIVLNILVLYLLQQVYYLNHW